MARIWRWKNKIDNQFIMNSILSAKSWCRKAFHIFCVLKRHISFSMNIISPAKVGILRSATLLKQNEHLSSSWPVMDCSTHSIQTNNTGVPKLNPRYERISISSKPERIVIHQSKVFLVLPNFQQAPKVALNKQLPIIERATNLRTIRPSIWTDWACLRSAKCGRF